MGPTELLINSALSSLLLFGSPSTPSANLRSVESLYGQAAQNMSRPPGSARLGGAVAAHERVVTEQTSDAGVKLCPRIFVVLVGTGEDIGPTAPLTWQRPTAADKAVQDGASSNEAVAPHAEAVRWIQQATRLSDGNVADLLGIERLTVLNWEAGKPIKVKNLRRLMETKDVLARAQRWHSHPNELVAWLHTPDPDHGISPAKLLAQGEFDRARFLAVLGPSTVEPTPTWAKRPVPAAWQGALEEPDRPGEFVEDSS